MSGCDHHAACVSEALADAEKICEKAGVRLTATRRAILEMLWQSHQPRKAYDLLAALSIKDTSAKPPTVYRALDFLLEMGLVHKVDSLNAFIACNSQHTHQYLICQNCGTVADIHDEDLNTMVQEKADRHGFRMTSPIIEVKGICAGCIAKDL